MRPYRPGSANGDLKQEISANGFPQWQVAERIGISDSTLCRWLRTPLPDWKRELILKAVAYLKAEKEGA